MYKSPIELLVADIQHQIVKQQDEEIYQAVLHYIPNVDKEELLRALEYDRNQYEKGYADGKRDAMAELVRCKDCDHRSDVLDCGNYLCNRKMIGMVRPNDFCSFGERREGE